jgi:SAM-dependent methyltransferase
LERSEYERLAAVEDRMWWFGGLHANLLAAWRVHAASADGVGQRVLLDAGCGTGGFLARLAAAAPGALVVGLDRDEGASRMAREKSGQPVAVGSIDALPFADGALDAIFSADVLCHRGVEEGAALAGFRRCLKPGGIVVLNLPAYRWLFSGHDVAVDNVRRYRRGELVALLAAAGFTVADAHYWNSFLFPLMVLRRKLPRGRGQAGGSDVALLVAPIERLFSACLALERGLEAAGIRLPFGGSILAIAVRK